MPYKIGDTIRLKCTVKDYSDVETLPDSITVTVYQKDGTILLNAAAPSLVGETTAQYYYDWQIPSTLDVDKAQLIVSWNFEMSEREHLASMKFEVETVLL